MAASALEQTLERFGALVAAKPKKIRPRLAGAPICLAHQTSDAMRCVPCAMTYDVNDPEPPTCPRTGQACRSSGR